MTWVDEKFKILVVEDNDADVYLLRKALDRAGLRYDMRVINDGADAIEFIKTVQASDMPTLDLAVIDLNLPGASGIEVVSILRSNDLLSRVPVCVVTSSSAGQDRVQAAQLGVGCFIVKPPDLDGMLLVGSALKDALLAARSAPNSAEAAS
jgi:chemotaxis family two-component system response regulator Rcp1